MSPRPADHTLPYRPVVSRARVRRVLPGEPDGYTPWECSAGSAERAGWVQRRRSSRTGGHLTISSLRRRRMQWKIAAGLGLATVLAASAALAQVPGAGAGARPGAGGQ